VARIAGVDLPREKRIEAALPYIYGIGHSSAKQILQKAGIDPNIRVKDLTTDQVAKIRDIIASDYKVEGALRAEVQMNIKRLMDIGCYRGLRHRRGGFPRAVSAPGPMPGPGRAVAKPSASVRKKKGSRPPRPRDRTILAKRR